MADASLVVRIRSTGERNLKQIRRDLDRISVSAATAGASLKAFARGYNQSTTDYLNKTKKGFTKHFDELDSLVKMAGGTLLKSLGLALKATGAEFALMGVSMIAVHGLFSIGQALMKVYRGALTLLTGAAASFVVALSAAAAAIRENNAAMFAYKASGYQQFGNNLNQVRVVMRGLESDASLAAVGVENLNAAYASVSKRSTFTRGSQTMLKGLMDFASAGQPLEQGVKAAGELIGILQDPKASFSEISKAAEALGPSMKKAMEEAKKQGINTADALKKAINDGTLAGLGGVEGQFDAVNSTLMSVMKSGMNQMRSMFADMGQPFLKPLKESFDEILVIFRRTFMRVQGDLNKFGKGPFMDGLVGAVEKLENIFVSLIRDYLPATYGMFDRWGSAWNKFVDGWNRILDALRPLIAGSQVLLSVLNRIFGPVWELIKKKFDSFGAALQDNKPALLEWGDSMGRMLVSLGEITSTVKELYFQAVPFITKIFDGLTQVFTLMNDVFSGMSKMFGSSGDGFGAFATLMGIGIVGRSMKNTKGGFIPSKMDNMNIAANNVTITGATAGGQMFPNTGVTGPPASPLRDGYPGSSDSLLKDGYKSKKAAKHGDENKGLMSVAGRKPEGPLKDLDQSKLPGGKTLTVAQAKDAGMTSKQAAAYNKQIRAQNFTPYQGSSKVGQIASKAQQFSGTRGFRAGRENSRSYQATMRANQSGTARMGTMAGLGLLGSYMPEETQGAMALGSTVAAINPLLGLGVAGLGTALTSQNAGIGIAGGVAGGAAIGMQLAGPWGAAGGAIIGGVVGGLKASINKNNARKDEARAVAKGAADGILESMMSGISQAGKDNKIEGFKASGLKETLGLNRIEDVVIKSFEFQKDVGEKTHEQRQALVRKLYSQREALGFEMSLTELDKALEKPHEFLELLHDDLSPVMEAGNLVVQKFTSRMELFTRTLRMTEEEVMSLAQATGTNLYDATQTATQMIEKMVQGLIGNKEQLDGAFADVSAGVLSSLNKVQKREEAPKIMNEAAQALLDASRSGDLTQQAVATQMQAMYGGLVDVYEGDTTRAALTFMNEFGAGQGSFQQGDLFSSLSPEDKATFDTAIAPAIAELTEFLKGNPFSDTLITAFAAKGFEADSTNITEVIDALALADPRRLMAFYDKLDEVSLANMTWDELYDFTMKAFPELDLGLAEIAGSSADIAANLETLGAAVGVALEKYITQLNTAAAALVIAPTTVVADDGDTRTPRGTGDTSSSRYSQTMSAHNQLDSMTSGKRFMTSGWRNYNLGSPSSDHVMGRAYDLVGQNLGAYKSMVDASGGFAEFHASAGDRHLHVVPNVDAGGAVGDSSSVATMGGGMGGGTTNNNSYTINVNGASQSPQEIAEAVMQRIKMDEISMRERR
jgi:hypothetical protein